MIEVNKNRIVAAVLPAQQFVLKDAIIMKEDNEGFLYPTVDKENCIDCGACERVCPIIHTAKEKPFEQAAYIVQNKDQKS